MQTFDLETQQKITRLIEYVLEPLQGKVVHFGDLYKMQHRAKNGDNPWVEWEEIFYPVFVKISDKEMDVSLSSLHLSKIESAVWRGCHDLAYTTLISDEERGLILRRLYSSEFLNYLTQK